MRTERQDTVVVGGGQSGLATSFLLGQRDRDHVILEQQQQVAASWRQRWDSFTLVTPNWQLCLPGFGYQGDDPEGFLTRDEVVAHVEDYAASFTPPLRLGVTVTKVAPAETGDGYVVHTTDGAHPR